MCYSRLGLAQEISNSNVVVVKHNKIIENFVLQAITVKKMWLKGSMTEFNFLCHIFFRGSVTLYSVGAKQ